ncbi:MAG: Acyl dehydratase [uncultured Acetobacteraceae bacterium]|uniref:Acyl dehydratase n=1 Tax=uncultured Acetobacteraceae bacterium TaxID=169975 RepID=A0A6J4IW50_9PROT|nr:MAG: Acyl dehydratase [uncultured Acetobacteraceae bacterium]
MSRPGTGEDAGGPPPLLGRGFHWHELREGQRFRTFRRTVTETDLVNFVSATGMLEPLFVDATHEGAMGPRPVPAALTWALIEGILLRTMLHGTGLALLEASQRALLPVRVGDTIGAEVTVTGVRPTSRGNRAVVASDVRVLNGRGECVMTYTATRLVAGAPPDA